MSLAGKIHAVRQQPAVAARPIRFFARLAVWFVRSHVGRGATVRFERFGVRFWCPPEWRGMSKMAYALRDDCEPDLAHLSRWVKPGDTVIDVGAHYGSYTIPLAVLVGPGGSVIAVEPSLDAIAVLGRNMAINRLRNVYARRVAVGEQAGLAVLRTPEDPTRASLAVVADPVESQAVEVVRLDDLMPPERVSFVKIDVEGFELPALRGGLQLIQRDRPVIQLEVLGEASAAQELLESLGYSFERVPGSHNRIALPG